MISGNDILTFICVSLFVCDIYTIKHALDFMTKIKHEISASCQLAALFPLLMECRRSFFIISGNVQTGGAGNGNSGSSTKGRLGLISRSTSET